MAKKRWSANPTMHEVADELWREITMREYVYGRKVADDQMTQEEMDHRIACIRRAAEIVDTKAGPRPQQEELF